MHLRRATLLAMLLLASSLVCADEPVEIVEAFLYPSGDLSARDEVFAVYGDNCGRAHPDPERAAEVRRDGDRIEIDFFLVEPVEEVCPAALLPDQLVPVSLGTLPKGSYAVERRLHLRPDRDAPYVLAARSWLGLTVGDVPHAAASGIWFSPDAPGNGLVLNLLASADGVGEGLAAVFIATRGADGAPEWLSGVGRFVDATLQVEVRRSNTPPQAAPDGVLAFRYLGCAQATLQLDGALLQFPAGMTNLQQMTRTKGVDHCGPPRERPVTAR